MKKSLVLPAFVGARNIEGLFRFCTDLANSHGDLEIDASHVGFIDPFGLAVLTAALSPICNTRSVRIVWLQVNIASFLKRMHFFAHCPVDGVEAGDEGSDRHNSVVEVMKVGNAHETDDAAERLATALTGSITGSHSSQPVDFQHGPSAFDRYHRPLAYAFTELLDNALTHARREGRRDAVVWVAAHHYPDDADGAGLVRIGVADNGCGFLATLATHPQLKAQSHRAAIELALQPFISCNRDIGPFAKSANEGVGLTTTYAIAQAANGGMTLISGNGRYTSGRGGSDMPPPAFWPGVAISFVCRRNLLPLISPSDLLPEIPANEHPQPNLRFAD